MLQLYIQQQTEGIRDKLPQEAAKKKQKNNQMKSLNKQSFINAHAETIIIF